MSYHLQCIDTAINAVLEATYFKYIVFLY